LVPSRALFSHCFLFLFYLYYWVPSFILINLDKKNLLYFSIILFLFLFFLFCFVLILLFFFLFLKYYYSFILMSVKVQKRSGPSISDKSEGKRSKNGLGSSQTACHASHSICRVHFSPSQGNSVASLEQTLAQDPSL